ncbi:hypothetical protein SAMN05421829_101128 [Aromatoleum tolulyticum]|uniref:Uncharacterized protein n=1 Tax=Aromatoleum tolulyticum TaxID=34027 RepID=A0A1N6N6T7_9RHOO|nr:hypothetical protein SAMN05421829_101128 [Aromatoleum tolulyticum]
MKQPSDLRAALHHGIAKTVPRKVAVLPEVELHGRGSSDLDACQFFVVDEVSYRHFNIDFQTSNRNHDEVWSEIAA